jgi:hypothetical protein
MRFVKTLIIPSLGTIQNWLASGKYPYLERKIYTREAITSRIHGKLNYLQLQTR